MLEGGGVTGKGKRARHIFFFALMQLHVCVSCCPFAFGILKYSCLWFHFLLFVCCPFILSSLFLFGFFGGTTCTAIIATAAPPIKCVHPSPPRLPNAHYPPCVVCYKVIVAGDPDAADTQALISAAQRSFCPNLILIVEDTSAQLNEKQAVEKEEKDEEPLFRDMLEAYGGGYGTGEDGEASAYVCFDNSCSRPVRTAEALRGLLD